MRGWSIEIGTTDSPPETLNTRLSHSKLYQAWVENERERKMISYKDYAFELSI